jgi:hypothetical protein
MIRSARKVPLTPRVRTTVDRLLLAVFLLILSACAFAGAESSASVGFTFDFPGSIPDHYQMVIYSDGHATYDSAGKLTPDGDAPDPFHLDFQVTPATKSKVFDLTARAKFFQGKVDSGKKGLASTGDKTLAYQDGPQKNEARYNYSPVTAVQELTSVFQNISTTLEFGRRLDYYHHYQKMALEEELKHMEESTHSGNLAELQAVTPILKEILADTSVMNVTRARAQRLLAQATAH